MEQAGMGVGVGDYNLDGHLDIFKTHFADDTMVFIATTVRGIPRRDHAARLAVETRYVCWGAGIVDLDNDGWPESSLPRAGLSARSRRSSRSFRSKSPRDVFRNLGDGKFEQLIEQAGPGVVGRPLQPRMCIRRFRQ